MAPVTIDTAQVAAVLGTPGLASGAVTQLSFILVKGSIALDGDSVPAALAAGSPVNLQAVTADRFVATGDFAVTRDHVQPVVGALAAHGISATGLHTHLMGENPPIYFIHFWADGHPADVLGGIKAALDAGQR
jgi:hypothetical protein